MARAAPEEVVGQPGVMYLGLVGAVAIAWGWEREAEAEGEGDGKVRRSEAERREDGDGVEPIPCPVTRQREQALCVARTGVQLHLAGRRHLVCISGGVDLKGESVLEWGARGLLAFGAQEFQCMGRHGRLTPCQPVGGCMRRGGCERAPDPTPTTRSVGGSPGAWCGSSS
ncbi:hypothetical protein CLOM_g12314 [Closterium sp. NIES-68]|nr:hypothetical protein CLOM_g12314 [Closterium sp. NIES-68]GJP59524.1 hypothetical protein CLOP_g12429 [Closterium sp. NIES-67]